MGPKPFEFELGATVQMAMTDEQGLVVGRAENLDSDHQYNVRFRAADGRQCQDWFYASAITAA